jgi:hypothetical protein
LFDTATLPAVTIVLGPFGDLVNANSDLERLQQDAQRIFDAHIDELHIQHPDTPFGVLKAREIATPAGSTLNYIAALKMLREKFTRTARRRQYCLAGD